MRPLKTALDDLQDLLQAQPVTLAELPPDIVEQWMTPDGRARVEALPKGDPNDNETLRSFARAVLAVEPDAIGGPISILESGDTIVRAFFEAGAWALISIAILLWIVLRRFGDVLLTLVPLLLAGVVTLELCVRDRTCRSTSPTSSRCRCCSASASRSRSTTSWRGAPGRPTCCSRA